MLSALWYVQPLGWATAAAAQDGPPGASDAGRYAITPEPARELQVLATPEHPAYTLYTPGGFNGPPSSNLTLVVFHGMGGNGPGMAATVLPYARERGWIVVAPTIQYGEWRDPNQLLAEELRLEPQLPRLLDAMPAETHVVPSERVLLFGFSRGAQAILRFALLYPERVEGVAALSAGTYTLPAKSVKTAAGVTLAAPFPYGVADVEQRLGRGVNQAELATVRFWIGVGAKDNRDSDVPRQWDPFVGKNRVERAERFAGALTQLGCQAQVTVIPDAGHELSPSTVGPATTFLSDVAANLQAQLAAATTSEPVPPPTVPALQVPRGI